MDSSSQFINLFRKSINCLIQTNIDFIVVGGSILPYFSGFRTTLDIDLMLLVDPSEKTKLKELVRCFNNNAISITLDEISDAFEQNIHVSGFDETTWTYRLDIKMISSAFDYLTFNTKIMAQLYDITVPISSPENLIAIKISEGFQSNQDLEDIASVIETTEINIGLLIEALDLLNSRRRLINFLTELNTENSRSIVEKLKESK